MDWKKAGRPRKEKPEWLEQTWTKEELSVITATAKAAPVMLAIAVVKQWQRDGMPESEIEGIRPWLHMIKDSLKQKGTAHEQRIHDNGSQQETL